MSAFLPSPRANARHFAYRCAQNEIALASGETRRRIRLTRVRQVFQSDPADYRYPLTCGRLCVSPSHPPASFSRPFPSSGAVNNCRQLASPCSHSVQAPVTRGARPATVGVIKPLTQGAKNESRTTDFLHHGIGIRAGRRIRLQPGRDDVSIRMVDGAPDVALNPLPLTTHERLPACIAPRGRFVVPAPFPKESACSTRS